MQNMHKNAILKYKRLVATIRLQTICFLSIIITLLLCYIYIFFFLSLFISNMQAKSYQFLLHKNIIRVLPWLREARKI